MFIKRTLLLAKSHFFSPEPVGLPHATHIANFNPLVVGLLCLLASSFWWFNGSCINPFFYSCHCALTHSRIWAVCDCVLLTTVHAPFAGFAYVIKPVFDSMKSGHVQFLFIHWFPFERQREREDLKYVVTQGHFFWFVYLPLLLGILVTCRYSLSFFSYRCILVEEEEKKISLPFS